jgi:Ca2+-transporting ATPase
MEIYMNEIEYYKLSEQKVLEELNSSMKGLSQKEAEQRLKSYGKNLLTEKKKKTDIELFIDQFKSFLILILLFAILLSFLVGEYLDSILILVIVLLNAILGFIQAKKAEEAVESLKKLMIPTVKVIRDNELKQISSSELVPGDIVVMSTGDRVPADCRILNQINLKVDESLLTGESVPVSKTSAKINKDEPIQNRHNMLYLGTSVVYGRCEAVVVSTGMNTEFGKIALSIQEEEEITPLQKKLDSFGRFLGYVFLALCFIVFILGVLTGNGIIEMAIVSISLAVAAVPEGLLASITIALSLGVAIMAKSNAVVRRLTAVEGLGNVTVICTDKTGTLTVNQMTVKKIFTIESEYDVSGEGYSLEGKIIDKKGKTPSNYSPELELLLETGVHCNDAFIDKEAIGDPTEISLLISAKKAGIKDRRSEMRRLDEIQFDSERKMMSVLYPIDRASTAFNIKGTKFKEAKNVIYVKGAAEKILAKSSFVMINGKVKKITAADKKKILQKEKEYASSSFRVMAFAIKFTDANKIQEEDLIFLGLQAMLDPPRPEAKEAIQLCKKAGIDVVMITGDHKETAIAIGKELGIIDNGIALTGQEIEKMSDEELLEKISEVKIFARVAPEHKVRITKLLKKKGEIVAMTGDGINDAPALKAADIGVAMGKRGADVTREVADLVIMDDNFATIVKAVEQGRGIYDNLRRVVAFLLSGNIAEVFIIFLAMLIGLPLPLIAIQILWINLVTDGLPALSLSINPIDKSVMNKKPRSPKEEITDGLEIYIIEYPILLTFVSLFSFAYFWFTTNNLLLSQTVIFSLVVFFELFQAFSCIDIEKPVKGKLFSNKYLVLTALSVFLIQLFIIYYEPANLIFNTSPLLLEQLLYIIVISSLSFLYIEWRKGLKYNSKEMTK